MTRGRFTGDLVAGLREVATRFPIPLLAVLLLVAYANSRVAIAGPDTPRTLDLLLALASAVFLSLAATLAAESRRARPAATHMFAACAGLLAFGIVWLKQSLGTLPLAVLAVSFGSVFLAPFLGRGTSLEFWSYGRRLVLELALAGLLLAAVAGGGMAVTGAASYLFEVDTPERVYGHMAITAATLVAPLFALSRLPRRFDELPEDMLGDTFLFSALRGLADFVATPVFLALILIFHLYAGRTLYDGALPKGEIGWLVLFVGIGMIALLVAFAPFRPVARAPLRFFLRFWPAMLPVPLLLLAVAVWQRIGQYGITPERYLLVLFGIALTALALLQGFRRTRGDVRLLAGVPILALLAASFGPWGAVHVSVSDQAARFRALVADPNRSLKQEADAKNLLRFLADHDALELVAPEAANIGDTHDGEQRQAAIARVERALGLTDRPISDERGPDRFSLVFDRTAFDPAGFDLVVPSSALSPADGGSVRLSRGRNIGGVVEGFRHPRQPRWRRAGFRLSPRHSRSGDALRRAGRLGTGPAGGRPQGEAGRDARRRAVHARRGIAFEK